MSLTDALLLDPYPFDYYLAYRTDGVKGTGSSINDPYDCSTSYAAPISVTNLANTGQEATATVSSVAGIANGDVFTISGVTGAGATRWNGTFPIYGVDTMTNSFKYYMTGQPTAAPTVGDVKTAAKVTGFKFDDIMNSLPANVRVNLGPTASGKPFLTRGYADGVSGGFQPKAGMKISGAGMDVTVLQLIPSASSNAHFFAIGPCVDGGQPRRGEPPGFPRN